MMLKFKYVKVYPCLHQFFSLGAATVNLAESILSMSQKLEVMFRAEGTPPPLLWMLSAVSAPLTTLYAGSNV